MSTVAARLNSVPTPRKLWTRDEYRSLMTLGILEDGSPYELIEGEIVEKMPQGRKHIDACSRTTRITARIFGDDRIQSQAPVTTDNLNVPEPDIAVLRLPVDSYMADDPGPGDLLLVIEISSTSLQIDRTIKAAVYARAGIADYWVIDVNGRVLHVYRSPSADGYAEVTTLGAEDKISPLAAPEEMILVADLLPPMEA